MPHLEKTATVNSDPKTVFAYLADRENAPTLVPDLARIWDIYPAAPSIGQTWKWEFRLLGKLSFEGTAEMTAFDPPRRLAFRTSGKLPSTWIYSIEPQDNQSKVTVSVDYDIPETIWGKLADKIAFSRMNESQIEQVLANLGSELGK